METDELTESVKDMEINCLIEDPMVCVYEKVDLQNKVVTEVEIHVQSDVYRLVKEIDTYVQEEVVSDIPLPEVYKVDAEIHTDMQLEKQVIMPLTIYSAKEMGVTQSKPKLFQNMNYLPKKYIPKAISRYCSAKSIATNFIIRNVRNSRQINYHNTCKLWRDYKV